MRALLLAILGLVLLGGCVHPRAVGSRGPTTLEEAAALAPEGERRASIHLVARADRALADGSLGTARDLASRAIRIDGQNPYAYLLLGEVGAASGEYQAALRYLEQAKLLFEMTDPPSEIWISRVLRLMADLLEEMGEVDRARRLRREAGSLDRRQRGPPGWLWW
jgi:tetratricopeptide (TPR) repeat protein